MNTKVTLTINPREFDLIRAAVVSSREDAEALAKSNSLDAKARSESRTLAARYADLEGRLNS